jgi:NADPH:quinone reductase-like Zn-dependent oxidoreductase
MKAVYYTQWGSSDVLQYGEVATPTPAANELLVAVRAAGVNPVDWKVREGYLKDFMPSEFPIITGWDAAGVVTAVGAGVTGFAVGDEVYGYVRKPLIKDGTFAEFVVASPDYFGKKPANVSFEEAGALPLVGLTALQSLQAAGLKSGETVLVHAAAGGVGHVAVQIAKAMGAARVIGTASERNHDYLRSLGVEPVAYGPGLNDRVKALGGTVDVVADFVGGPDVTASYELVDPTRVVSIVDGGVAANGGHYVFTNPSAEGMAELAAWQEKGALKVEVAETFPLSETAAAHDRNAESKTRGKIVVTV